MVADVKIEGEYITLAQLLKKLNLISSGGEARTFLQEYEVLVNGQPEVRRGRKIRPGDQVIINGNQHNVI
ncbi:MAG: S4 domain-containing protein YaaA [Bacillota bacterium]|jgi:ribosome-associated protein